MAMPRGHKSKNGHASVATIPGADDYRLIAQKCTEMGYKMGNSTARNIFLGAMMKVADNLQKSQGNEFNRHQLYEIARNPKFQLCVAEFLNGEMNHGLELS